MSSLIPCKVGLRTRSIYGRYWPLPPHRFPGLLSGKQLAGGGGGGGGGGGEGA